MTIKDNNIDNVNLLGITGRPEYKVINLTEQVDFHTNLSKREGLSKKIIKKFKKDVDIPLHVTYPPFFTQVGNKFYLVGRYWAFWSALTDGVFKVIAMIFPEDYIEAISKFDRQETERFAHSESTGPHRSTSRREAIRATGAICPFCKSPVRVYMDETKAHSVKGGHLIHCERNIIDPTSPNYRKHCHFQLKLTDFEYDEYKSGRIRIAAMMSPIAGVICKNGKDLYKRLLHWGDRIEVSERCKDYFSSFPDCDCKHYKLLETSIPVDVEKAEN